MKIKYCDNYNTGVYHAYSSERLMRHIILGIFKIPRYFRLSLIIFNKFLIRNKLLLIEYKVAYSSDELLTELVVCQILATFMAVNLSWE